MPPCGEGEAAVAWVSHDQLRHHSATTKYLLDCAQMTQKEIDEFSRETKQELFENDPQIIQIFDISPTAEFDNCLKSLLDLPKRNYFEVDEIEKWIELICEAFAQDQAPESLLTLSSEMENVVYQLTGSHSIFSRSYGSPEQAMGEEVGEKQFVYQVGALIYDLLTGRPPFFVGNVSRQLHLATPQSMTERRRRLGIDGKLIPQRWETLVSACLAKDPEKRPDFGELVTRLFAEVGPVHPVRKKSFAALPKIAAAIGVLLLGTVLFSLYQTDTPGATVDTTPSVQALMQSEVAAPLMEPEPEASSEVTSRVIETPLELITDESPAPQILQPLEVASAPLEMMDINLELVEAPELRLPIIGEITRPLGSLFPESLTKKIRPAEKLAGQEPPKKGEPFQLDEIGMEMIWIEPLAIWVAKTEVTSEQYTKGGGKGFRKFEGTGRARDSISWNQAMAYCETLNQSEYEKGRLPKGYIYTLPTEAQWKVFVGDASLSHSVYGRSLASGPSEPGTRREIEFGLVDVRGNLWEWTLDYHTPSKPSLGKALRGGSYASNQKLVMDKNSRYYGAKDLAWFQYGFRFVLTPMKE